MGAGHYEGFVVPLHFVPLAWRSVVRYASSPGHTGIGGLGFGRYGGRRPCAQGAGFWIRRGGRGSRV